MQDAIKTVINANVRANKFIALEDMIQEVSITARISHHQARSIVDITIAAMKIYSKEFSKSFYSNMFKSRNLMMGNVKYSFTTATTAYFKWLRKGLDFIDANTVDGELYLIQNGNSKLFKEYILLLGIFESYEILTFKALGGRNSQLYIYVNQTKTMKEIINRPGYYKNKLLELVGQRHILSVQMLTYLFESDFDNDKTWDVIEDYFLGQIPDPVKRAYEEKTGSSLQVYN
jgi:ATP-dependent DNA helicase RecQ